MTIRIIDRDISFYEGEIERTTSRIRTCLAADECFWKDLREAAIEVVTGLRKYREALAASL
jgi:hypothetical protein